MVNDSKTEFLIAGSKEQLERVNIPFIMWVSIRWHLWRQWETWMWFFYFNLKMDIHITKACQYACYHLHNIRRIRKFPSQEATCTVIRAFITSQIDYCNRLMNGLPENLVKKLQRLHLIKHSCQASFQSEEIWSHNSCTQLRFTGFQSNTRLNSKHCWSSSSMSTDALRIIRLWNNGICCMFYCILWVFSRVEIDLFGAMALDTGSKCLSTSWGIVSGDGLMTWSNKPLPEPVLTQV